MRLSSILSLISSLVSRISAVTDSPGYDIPANPSSFSPTASNVSVVPNGKFQWQIWAKCSDEEKKQVTQAWEDSKLLSDAFAQWEPNGRYQAAVNMYMGTRSTYKDFLGYDFPKMIQGMRGIER